MKAKRGTRHPGVVLMKPEPTRPSWRIRYRHPETGLIVKETVPPELNTKRGALAFARMKSAELGRSDVGAQVSALWSLARQTALCAARAGVERRDFLNMCRDVFDAAGGECVG